MSDPAADFDSVMNLAVKDGFMRDRKMLVMAAFSFSPWEFDVFRRLGADFNSVLTELIKVGS